MADIDGYTPFSRQILEIIYLFSGWNMFFRAKSWIAKIVRGQLSYDSSSLALQKGCLTLTPFQSHKIVNRGSTSWQSKHVFNLACWWEGQSKKISRIDDIDEVRPGMGESKRPEMPPWKYDSVSSLHFRDAYLCAWVFIWFHPLWLKMTGLKRMCGLALQATHCGSVRNTCGIQYTGITWKLERGVAQTVCVFTTCVNPFIRIYV